MPSISDKKAFVVFVLDLLLFGASLHLSYLLRFDFSLGQEALAQLRGALPLFVLIKAATFLMFGLYGSIWRFSGARDVVKLSQAVLCSSLAAFAALYLETRLSGYSRAVLLMDAALTFVMCGGMRMAIRVHLTTRHNARAWRMLGLSAMGRAPSGAKRALIIGAGGAGEKILREIFENPRLDYDILGFLDDDPGKKGRMVHGVRVLGAVADLPRLLERVPVAEALIAIPTAAGSQVRRIVETCKECGVRFKTLPGIGEIIDGRVSVKTLREVSYDDLLGRPPVRLDDGRVSGYLTGKTILVTGGGGSIGSELCRQIVKRQPARLVVVDNGEANLHHVQTELKHECGFKDLVPVLGRVQDKMMDRVFDRYRPQAVFHAAAYKHVPMMERNPWEAMFNNVLGSRNVMETARRHGVDRFVLVSTDKAVRPTNVMGASKRVAELLLQAMPQGRTRFMAVRFGNVLGSSGSVIPLFRRQIERGGPVTVTHPEMTRYFMSIPEAAQLILQAGAMGEGGEIFLLKMGSPVKIVDMAMDLIRLSGKRPREDVEIKFVGLRPGEKLYEELITGGEGDIATEHDRIMILKPDDPATLRGPAQGRRLAKAVEALTEAASRQDSRRIRALLQEIVPEYVIKDDAEEAGVLGSDSPAPARRDQGGAEEILDWRPALGLR